METNLATSTSRPFCVCFRSSNNRVGMGHEPSKDHHHVDKPCGIYGELGDNGTAWADWLVIDDPKGRSNVDPDRGSYPCDDLSPLPAIVRK